MPIYPFYLEDFWNQALVNHFKTDLASCLEKLEPYVEYLSNLFTADRPKQFKDYQEDPAYILAYGVYFFPQSYVRSIFPIAQAFQYNKWLPAPSIRILDLGSSMAPASLGIAHFLKDKTNTIHIDAVDHSSSSLAYTHTIVKASQVHQQNLTVKTHCENFKKYVSIKKGQNDSKYDLIILSFSLNEVFNQSNITDCLQFLKNLKTFLKPKGLIVILEPALKETALHLQSIHNHFVTDHTYQAYGPTLGNHCLPMLENNKYWHHEVRNWQIPTNLQYINRHLWRSIATLKFSYTLLSHPDNTLVPPESDHFRLISPLALTKGGFLFKCLSYKGEAYNFDMPIRGLSKSTIKEYQSIQRGDILNLTAIIPLKKDYYYRVQPECFKHIYSPSF